jgi:hypothetical protein
MLNFYAAKFVEVTNTIADIERMLTFAPERLANGAPDPAPILAQQLRWLAQQTKALSCLSPMQRLPQPYGARRIRRNTIPSNPAI